MEGSRGLYALYTKCFVQYGGCQRDRDPPAKSGYAGSSIPSISRFLAAWPWNHRVRCLERRGESFSWNIFHGSNVRDVGLREHGQRFWYVPLSPGIISLVLVKVESTLVTTGTERGERGGNGDQY